MMVWHTVEQSPGSLLIQNGPLVVGSIQLRDGKWNVEILWSGPHGDITFEGADYSTALAFVEGVRKTFEVFDHEHI